MINDYEYIKHIFEKKLIKDSVVRKFRRTATNDKNYILPGNLPGNLQGNILIV